ncbi:HypC/HybG/HupF family hydrogenase formation chaperone [Candidatus Pacearchaeota archaeon]|nr:HypC/HybG/HupF family hydrogenase formation chaperone [Candidatus Pacearchaeota archaeon]
MCLSIPGKVEKIENGKIIVDYGSGKRTADFSLADIQEGDYVIVKEKIVIEKIPKKEAEEYLKLIKNAGKND